jgi:hypothetical protein
MSLRTSWKEVYLSNDTTWDPPLNLAWQSLEVKVLATAGHNRRWIDTDSINEYYQFNFFMLPIHRLKILQLWSIVLIIDHDPDQTDGHQSIGTHLIDSIDPSIKPGHFDKRFLA